MNTTVAISLFNHGVHGTDSLHYDNSKIRIFALNHGELWKRIHF